MPSNVALLIELESWARRRTSSQALAQRSRIVLLAAEGRQNVQIAAGPGPQPAWVWVLLPLYGATRL